MIDPSCVTLLSEYLKKLDEMTELEALPDALMAIFLEQLEEFRIYCLCISFLPVNAKDMTAIAKRVKKELISSLTNEGWKEIFKIAQEGAVGIKRATVVLQTYPELFEKNPEATVFDEWRLRPRGDS